MRYAHLFIFLFFFSLVSLFVSAHVGYVLDKDMFHLSQGKDSAFLLAALQDPLNLFLIILTILIVVGAFEYLPRSSWFGHEFSFIRKQVHEYAEYVPWIARLGIGITLIGAGTHQVLISPFLSTHGLLSTVQIACGFFILAGFLVGPVTLIAGILFLIGLLGNFYILGNLDFLGLVLVILALHDEKPGVDDLLGIPFLPAFEKLKKYAPLLARLSVGIAMLFLAFYEKLLNPHTAAQVVEQYGLTSVVPVSTAMWVLGAGVVESIIGLALLFGYRTRTVSAIAMFVLSLSFFYFGEDVYSHVTLFATLSIIFIYGNEKIKKRKSAKIISIRVEKKNKRKKVKKR